jgi:DNA-directed RNA polymerase specialized sigma24 family protein
VEVGSLDALVRKVIAGDARAWQALWSAIEPTVWHITGKWQIVGPLSRRDEDRRDIVVEVMDRLRQGGFRRLKAYLDSCAGRPSSSFKTWLATVTARAAIDHVRAHPEFSDTRGRPGTEPSWVRVVPMANVDAGTTTSDATTSAAASQLLERAKVELRGEQLRALSMWLEDASHADIAIELGLADPHEADRLVRSALKRLRDRFGASIDPSMRPDTRQGGGMT